MSLLVLVALSACKGPIDDGDDYLPDLHCPGDPSGACDPVDAPLRAGAAVLSVVPDCYESWQDSNGDQEWSGTEPILDCGCDRLCPGDPGYPGPDEGEDDDRFQALWLAGGSSGLPVQGVRDGALGLRGDGDGLWARAIVLEQGNTTVAIVAFDLIGIFHDDTLRIREAVAARGLDVDHVVVHATHVHAAPDMMGLWGRSITESGYDERYAEQVRTTGVDAIEQALGALTEVSLVVGAVDASEYAAKGVFNVNADTRDPWIIDQELRAARFVDTDGNTVATLVNWASHPETLLNDNALMTSDFVHALRATVEDGVVWNGSSRAGLGGPCIYLQGAVGGLLTILPVHPVDPDGTEWAAKSWEKMDVIGQLLGEMALDAIEQGETVDDPRLALKVQGFDLPIENRGLQAMALLEVISRTTYNWDESQPIDDDNLPWVRTEVNVVDVGPVQLLTLPGEPLPEVVIGGYDGSRVNAPDVDFIDPNNPNPPDVDAAPAGPYLADLMTGGHNWVVGLGNDELGYMIPSYDFELHGGAPYILEAEGDHYEETNSLGPQTVERVHEHAARLLGWQP